ncbi:MAG: sulfite exporter TauE/SafE family protein [Leptolyngbyaceae bacterium]|nr:sulfite exporter TauE/SafE family protein [Leptolyngbyaceae bacterium]
MQIVLFVLASIISWFFSMLAGGGSSLILMPVVGTFLGAQAIPAILTIGGLCGNSERMYIYRDRINWQIVRWELPGAVIGAILGAFSLSQLTLEWLAIVVALFLLVSALSFFCKSQDINFTVKAWYFLPTGFIYAFLSGLIGSMGPIFAPLYFSFGLQKEAVIATQATNRVVIHCIKLVAYGVFGTLQLSHVGYGLIVGASAFIGNWLGSLVLEKISEQRFRQLVFSFLLFSGFFMLWQHRAVVGLSSF